MYYVATYSYIRIVCAYRTWLINPLKARKQLYAHIYLSGKIMSKRQCQRVKALKEGAIEFIKMIVYAYVSHKNYFTSNPKSLFNYISNLFLQHTK